MTGVAASTVQERIAAQVAAAQAREQQVRGREPEGVHQMRVALRRLRSALVTFRPLLDREVTEPLREEIKWIAGLLGEVRDLHVTEKRFDDLVASEPADLVVGPVAQRLREQLDEDLREANTRLDEAMGSARYAALMAAVASLGESPPWAPEAQKAGGGVLRKRVRHDFRRLRDAVADVDEASTREERDEKFHEVRKAAKRARYAAETVEPRYGGQARRFAEAMEEIQTILGDQHDAVTAQARLREAADRADAAGESAFTYGRLHAREFRQADDLIAEFERTWPKAQRKKLRRWL